MPVHIPVLRHGVPYTSLDSATVPHYRTREPFAELSLANGGLSRRDLREEQQAAAREALMLVPFARLLGVADGEDRAMRLGGHRVEKLDHFGGTEDDRQCLGLFRCGDHGRDGLGLVEADRVEKAERLHGDDDGAGRQLFLSG